MAKNETDYRSEAEEAAWDMVEEFKDEMAESYCDNDGEISDDLFNDYTRGDEYHHQSNVDKSYSLTEAAELLEQLDEFEETDEGLWEGQSPKEAISTQAAYTYGAAVYSMWRDTVKDLQEKLQELYGTDSSQFEERVEEDDNLDADDYWRSAVQKWMTAYVWAKSRYSLNVDRPMMDAIIAGLEEGDFTAMMVYADKVDERGSNSYAETVRAMAR